MRAMRLSWVTADVVRSFETENTTAHRICSHPSGWIERLGRDMLISWRNTIFRDAGLAGVRSWAADCVVAVDRIFARELPRRPEDRSRPVLVDGPADGPLQTVVLERGMRFLVDFSAGYSTGVFLDQRRNRELVQEWAPRRTLNLFAYTCTFSVCAALGGGITTSIDLSRKSLDRGRQNFSENGLDPAAHKFVAGDVLRILPRLARDGRMFDCVIVDPPTFSRGAGGRPFRVADDFSDLALAALAVTARGGRVLLSTNSAKMASAGVAAAARYALRASRRSAELRSEAPPPDIPEHDAAKTLWLLLKD